MAKTTTKSKPVGTGSLGSAGNGVLPTSEVLTLPEAAAFLRVSEDGLKTDAVAGRVPGRLVAGEWRFVKATLLRWLSEPEKPTEGGDWKQRLLSVAGSWKDDPTVDAMIDEIYRERKKHPVGGA